MAHQLLSVMRPPSSGLRRRSLTSAGVGMTKNGAGKYCCDCDYCAVSPCSEWGAIGSIFLTDHPQTHNYYLYCPGHKALADRDAAAYLVAHPGVEIDPNE